MSQKVVIVGASSSQLSCFIVGYHQSFNHEVVIIEGKRRRITTTSNILSKSTIALPIPRRIADNQSDVSTGSKANSDNFLMDIANMKNEVQFVRKEKSENIIEVEKLNKQKQEEIPIFTGDLSTAKGWKFVFSLYFTSLTINFLQIKLINHFN